MQLVFIALRSFLNPNKKFFHQLSPEIKNNLKNTAFGNLISPSISIKNAAAYLISTIYVN